MYSSSGSIANILNHFGGLNVNNYRYSLDSSRFISEINNYSPIIIRIGWNNGGGHFVVGYGLDYEEIGRNLPHIYKLKN